MLVDNPYMLTKKCTRRQTAAACDFGVIMMGETRKMRPFVIIEDKKFPVGMMIWGRDGNIVKLTTRPEKQFGEFWDIEGDDLNKVTIIWEDNNQMNSDLKPRGMVG
ncbi:MAG: hypothetical protein GY801_44515 [bacterium]|nr:hypothetical protein [bacterium]